jgi:hypothetical protein
MDIGSPIDDVGAGLGNVLLRTSRRVRRFSATRGAAGKLDGRSSEAKYLRLVRKQLTGHVGGHPSAVQVAIIDRLAWLSLHMAKIDARTLVNGEMSDNARREYLAWSNSYSRLIRQLGMEGQDDKTPKPPTLADVVKRMKPRQR